jgi:hypothetical protein
MQPLPVLLTERRYRQLKQRGRDNKNSKRIRTYVNNISLELGLESNFCDQSRGRGTTERSPERLLTLISLFLLQVAAMIP